MPMVMYAKELDTQQVDCFRKWCSEARHIVLLSHMGADGDACGSLLGLAHQLDRAAPAATVTPILPNGCPSAFRWLPGSSRILSGDTERQRCEQCIARADLIVCLDINSPSRTDFLRQPLSDAAAHKVLIDHHHGPDVEAFDIVFSDPDISSTCEYLLWISLALWGKCHLSTDAARCLYAGLRTDTGGFAYSCSQPSCFHAAATLTAFDIDPAGIHNSIANSFSLNRMMLFGFAISQRLWVYPEKHTAIFAISLDDQRRLGVGPEDFEGLVNYTLMMADISIGACIREEAHRTKVSFRSKGADVNHLARQLGGGGHTAAAAAATAMPFLDTLRQVRRLLGVDGLQPANSTPLIP